MSKVYFPSVGKTLILFVDKNNTTITAMYHIPGNFRVTLFSQISQILLSREIKLRKSITILHPMWIICKYIFHEIIEISIFAKISDTKISHYTCMYIVQYKQFHLPF